MADYGAFSKWAQTQAEKGHTLKAVKDPTGTFNASWVCIETGEEFVMQWSHKDLAEFEKAKGE